MTNPNKETQNVETNETDTQEPATPATLSTKVESLRDQARDVLRMEAINKRLGKILSLKICIGNSEKSLEKVEKPIKIAEYNLAKLDEAHPDFEHMKEAREKDLECAKEDVEHNTKLYEHDIKEAQELVEKELEGIEKLETGDTKMDKDVITAIANELITKKA